MKKRGAAIVGGKLLFEGAVFGAKGDGLIASEEIDAGDIELDEAAGAEVAVGSAGIGCGIDAELDEADGVRTVGGGSAGLGLQADAVDDVPAAGLVELDEDAFAELVAFRILDGGGDLIEESEVVELALRIEEL